MMIRAFEQGSRGWGDRNARALVLLAAAALAAAALIAGLAVSRDDPQPAFAADATTAGATADMEVTKSDSPDPVVSGAVLTYTIMVKNNGPGTGLSAKLTDKLSGDFVSATATQGSCSIQGKTVTCSLGDVASGDTVTATIMMRPKKKSGTIDNTASVEITNVDPKPENDEDTEQTTITEAPAGPAGPTCKGKAATIVGTAGDDRGATALVGTSKRDVVVGLGGNDEIRTLGGKDLACGGPGNDVIKTGAKGDKAAGGGGRDKVNGGGGDDNLGGQGGKDKLLGRGGNDKLRGNQGRDVLKGHRGDDLLVGGPKKDKCNGGPGNDVLRSC